MNTYICILHREAHRVNSRRTNNLYERTHLHRNSREHIIIIFSLF